MKNQESIRYTYCHRKMVQYLAKRYVKEEQQKVYEQVQKEQAENEKNEESSDKKDKKDDVIDAEYEEK